MPGSENLVVRKFVPSLAKLSYNPVFATLLRASDLVPGKFFREFKRLSPNSMRARVGVGNRFFANRVRYTGQYLGINVDKNMVDWCNKNFDARFEFVLSSPTEVQQMLVATR